MIWSTETTDPKGGQTITGAPRVFNGKVIIGQAGADFGMRGYVTAFDQETGKQVWRFYVVPAGPEANKGDPAMEAAAKTWILAGSSAATTEPATATANSMNNRPV